MISTETKTPVMHRMRPAGVLAGAPLSRIHGPDAAFQLVAKEIAASEAALLELMHSDVSAVPVVAGYLACSGGKRLRPLLTALGARAVGFRGEVTQLMCAGELIHLGSLLHDDVVDEGELRRGQPAAHRVFGNALAVLTGDFCLARAMWLTSEVGGHAAVSALGRTVTEMAEGEVLQLKREGDLRCGRKEYFEVIDKKSAALIAWSCAAAAYANGDAAAAAALEQYGRGVGLSFQIADDIIDYLPGTGKVEGMDLRQRKLTLPLLMAMERLPELNKRLIEGPLLEEQVSGWLERIRGCGALEEAREEALARVDQALLALQQLPDSDGRAALETLGRYLVERVS